MAILKRNIALIVAIVFAALSSVSAYHYLGVRESVSIAKVAPNEPTLPVVVAKRDLGIGTKLTREHLVMQNWPKDIVTERYFRNPGQIIGRTLRTGINAEEPITAAKLLDEGETLTTMIPKDMRAITVTIRRSNHMEQILQRGCLVDVIAVLGEGESMLNTKVIAKAVRVLTVDGLDSQSKNAGNPSTMDVTLICSTTETNWIVYAMNHGTIELSVRNESAAEANAS